MIDERSDDSDATPKWRPSLAGKALDGAVRAALADPPSEEELALAGALMRTLRECIGHDPTRLAAASFGPAPATLALIDQAENACHADAEAAGQALDFVVWMSAYARAADRVAAARSTDAPEATAASGALPPWKAFSSFDQTRKLLTPKQAAEQLGVTAAALRTLAAQGTVPTVRRPNGRRAYSLAAIEEARNRLRVAEE